MLSPVDPGLPFILDIDVSNVGMRGVLSQMDPKG